jgi:hypothetical protein
MLSSSGPWTVGEVFAEYDPHVGADRRLLPLEQNRQLVPAESGGRVRRPEARQQPFSARDEQAAPASRPNEPFTNLKSSISANGTSVRCFWRAARAGAARIPSSQPRTRWRAPRVVSQVGGD